MGIDARIAVQFTTEPSHVRVKELQFHLMHRFGKDLFWCKTLGAEGGPKWVTQDFIQPIVEGKYFFDSDFDATGMWDVSLFCRYYGEGYERGPGSELAGVLYFLASQPDIREVRYGGDSSGTGGEVYTQETALGLFEKFCRTGHLPYTQVFDSNREGVDRPECSYCERPMHRNGFGGKYAAFYCEGCGEVLTLRDAEYDAWMSGRSYRGERKVTVLA